jgi:hypothetical protein
MRQAKEPPRGTRVIRRKTGESNLLAPPFVKAST